MNEREKFEEAFRKIDSFLSLNFNINKDWYFDRDVQTNWLIWQACAESKQEEIKQAYLKGVDDCAAIARNYIGA